MTKNKTFYVPPTTVEKELETKLLAAVESQQVPRSVVMRWSINAFLKAELTDADMGAKPGEGRAPTFLLTQEVGTAMVEKCKSLNCSVAEAVRVGLKLLEAPRP